MLDGIKRALRQWLEIQPSLQGGSMVLQQAYPYRVEGFINRLWYRGDAAELQQAHQLVDDLVENSSFWRAQSSGSVKIRKIHTGIPALMVNIMADIVARDFNGVTIDNDPQAQGTWDAIAKDNDFGSLLRDIAAGVMVDGDGAVKASVDTTVSDYPLLEWRGGLDVWYQRARGRVVGVDFVYDRSDAKRILREHYRRDGVTYTLTDMSGNPLEIEGLPPPIINQAGFMLAVPVFFGASPRWQGRGRSVYEGKLGCFDACDEAWSQWMDALRDARTITYIPDILIPRNPHTGELLKPNTFDRRFVETQSDRSEDGRNQIKAVAGDLRYDAYMATYTTALDLCLQGIISPSTLGIDVKKLDNAEAQREKEKVTLYTRGKLLEVLEPTIVQIVTMALNTHAMMHGQAPRKYEVSVAFGEYANPSFEAVVETVGKAKMQGVMSNAKVVDELYGDTMDKKEKAAEVELLDARDGMSSDYPAGAVDDLAPLQHNPSITESTVSSLNGAQVASLLAIVRSVRGGELGRSAAVTLVVNSFGLSAEVADQMLEEQGAI